MNIMPFIRSIHSFESSIDSRSSDAGVSRSKGNSGKYGWRLEEPSGTVAESVSVFGASGSMSCIVVVHRASLPESMTSESGEWILCRKGPAGGDSARFSLQWAADAPGSGCVALCGTEIPRFHPYPA